jgi:2-C-methyl-D-erythritol 4-phosphate cytidylyltransferase/2-C-methyl-D-erythritol 2,4-cyclodiphosphate synthase
VTARTGWGFDAHRFGGQPPILLAGVAVDPTRGLEATSDGDVVAHAVIDALLGAAALGDIGSLFPSSDPKWKGADSLVLLADARDRAASAGLKVSHLDVTVVSEEVRVGPHREAMRSRLAEVMELDQGQVSVKATTTDGLGLTSRDGVAAVAVVTGSTI